MTTTLAPVIRAFKPDEGNWAERAACFGHPEPDIWHADETSNHPWHLNAKRDAKEICNTMCPVRLDCLLWAVTHREATGIWGGQGPRDRTRIRNGTGRR